MKCVVCKQDHTEAGETTVTLERGGLTLVVRGVPAQVCPSCGEGYVDEDVAADLLRNRRGCGRGRCVGGCAPVHASCQGGVRNAVLGQGAAAMGMA